MPGFEPAPPRALVVDDDPVARAHAVGLLSHLGWRCYGVAKPGDALKAMAGFDDVRLALVDWHMEVDQPSGLELIRSLRALPNTQRLCIFLYTSDVGRSARDGSVAAGANGVLLKPLAREVLMDRLMQAGLHPI